MVSTDFLGQLNRNTLARVTPNSDMENFFSQVASRSTDIADTITIAEGYFNSNRDALSFYKWGSDAKVPKNRISKCGFIMANSYVEYLPSIFYDLGNEKLILFDADENGFQISVLMTSKDFHNIIKVCRGDDFTKLFGSVQTKDIMEELDCFMELFIGDVDSEVTAEKPEAAKQLMRVERDYVEQSVKLAIWELKKMLHVIQYQYDAGVDLSKWIENFGDAEWKDEATYKPMLAAIKQVHTSFSQMKARIRQIIAYNEVSNKLIEEEHKINSNELELTSNGTEWNITLSTPRGETGESFNMSENAPKESGYYLATVVDNPYGEKKTAILFWNPIKNYWEGSNNEQFTDPVLAYAKVEVSAFSNYEIVFDENQGHCIKKGE